ncbi:putative ABC transporter-binding protein precursor [Pelagimonas phthalicica]|uniref:Putative ABC transporter-binding protein n=1 Tax=Pelagimonas phthalicica TaxID=1037362 RepID=A0A238JJW1_9RHOB|nr:extracellular solute-binding protein [Pelagimonas phthalicica]TDS89909.1 carbohydrate ABC transporter substrate-binding protein (CUT1 family) [Pelagimonas phthalicica]SMX30076.1 putative ABC transporter-binding protein precursor [Pelagimonas phthalicica]
MFFRKVALSSALALMAGNAFACEISARVNIIGNEFPAIQTVGAGAAECTGSVVTKNLTADHKDIHVAGMQGNPAEYTSAIVANSTLTILMNDDLVRPLDDLVAKHGQSLQKSQLITVDGKVMAVAFMANAQHLMYRKDILADLGIEPPKTYEEMLDAAKMIRDKGVMQNPIGGAYAAGWNLAQEFNNMFIGYGGTFFKEGTAEPNINSEAGVNTLNMMKALTEYMNPDFLTHDSNATNAEYRAGNIALLNMWGSRAATQTTADGVTDAVKNGHAIAGPMTVGGGSTPASTLWWDGWTVAKNISDDEAEATFIAMMNGIRPELMQDAEVASQAVWLIEGYEPTEAAVGVFDAAKAGTVPYPMVPYMGLMHGAIGNELADFLQGKESAEQALADIEAAYRAAAVEKGFLK